MLLWLGLVSYGIYLWQSATLRGLADLTPLDGDIFDPSLWWIPFGFGACIAAGALSWYLLERYAMSLRRLVPPRSAAASPARRRRRPLVSRRSPLTGAAGSTARPR